MGDGVIGQKLFLFIRESFSWVGQVSIGCSNTHSPRTHTPFVVIGRTGLHSWRSNVKSILVVRSSLLSYSYFRAMQIVLVWQYARKSCISLFVALSDSNSVALYCEMVKKSSAQCCPPLSSSSSCQREKQERNIRFSSFLFSAICACTPSKKLS